MPEFPENEQADPSTVYPTTLHQCAANTEGEIPPGAFFQYLEPRDGPVVDGLEKFEVVYAKEQPQYKPLRTLRSAFFDHPVMSRFTLTGEQRTAVAAGADIFLTLVTFGKPLQPILMAVGSEPSPDYFKAVLGLGSIVDEITADAAVGKAPQPDELPRYRCHKEVHAFKIERIDPLTDGHAALIPTERYDSVIVDADFMRKHNPQAGGYYVRYADGYTSYSPEKAFEEGYTRIDLIEQKLARELDEHIAELDRMMRKTEAPPSIGRIVLYNHPGSADGKYPPSQSPAIIHQVHENGGVDLWVFGPKGIHKDGPLYYGYGPCQWQWPQRL